MAITESFREIMEYRDLLYMLTWRDIKTRYKQSMMGFFWAMLMPLLIVGAGILVRIVFSMASNHRIDFNDVSGIALKSVPWAFFVSAIKFGTNSMVSNPNLVTKIYMPREIFPLATILSQLLDLAIASCLVTIVFAVTHLGGSWQLVWVPLLLIVTIALATGWALLISAACLFFRDVKYLVEVVITFAIFVTPVFYDVHMFKKWANVLLLNPLAPLIEGLEKCIVYGSAPDLPWIAYSAAVALISTHLRP